MDTTRDAPCPPIPTSARAQRPPSSLSPIEPFADPPTAIPVPPSPPETPTSPSSSLGPATAARPSPATSRKSTISVRRKPVPTADDASSTLSRAHSSSALSTLSHMPSTDTLSSSATITSITLDRPPVYVLAVDPPLHLPSPSDPAGAPPYTPPPGQPARTGQSNPTFGVTLERDVPEDLPTYAEDCETEPKTLARGLWRWGFAFPLLWFIGMLILWIPLRPTDEEPGPESAQKLEEMIVIIRAAELRYARRCAIAFAAFSILLVVIIVAVVLANTL